MFLCNVFAPLDLIKLCLPAWKRQGGGIVINVTSSAGQTETPAPIGQGGWGLGYSLTKAAFNRMVPGLAKELRPYDVAVIGLMPGFVATERMAIELGDFGFDAVEGPAGREPGPRLRHARDRRRSDVVLGPRRLRTHLPHRARHHPFHLSAAGAQGHRGAGCGGLASGGASATRRPRAGYIPRISFPPSRIHRKGRWSSRSDSRADLISAVAIRMTRSPRARVRRVGDARGE